MPVSSSTEHWIKPDALTINLNHFGDPDYLQVSVLAGAVVMAFKQDVIGYNAAHNYRTWPLEAANTYLETSSAYNVYARLTRSEVNARALVIYDPILRDIEGREITYEKNEETGAEKEILGEPNETFYFIFLGQLSSSISEDGRSVLREWTSEYRSGSLETNEQQNDWMAILNKMFRPHYDDPLNPDTLTWIEAKAHMGIAGGLTSFIDNRTLNLPSIYDGLPIDYQTLYWVLDENGKKVMLKAAGGGGGVADSVHWDNIEGKPDFNQYATTDSLLGYLPLSGGTMTGQINMPVGIGNAIKFGEGSRLFASNGIFYISAETHLVFASGASGNNVPNNVVINKDGRMFIANNLAVGHAGFIIDSYKLNVAGDAYVNGKLVVNGTIYPSISSLHNIGDSSKRFACVYADSVDVGGVKISLLQDGVLLIDGNLAVTGGITSYVDGGDLDLPSIYDGLPIDGDTLYWVLDENGKKVMLKAAGGGGGVADSVHWDNIEGKPNFDDYATQDALKDYLPLSGGTMTGQINMPVGIGNAIKFGEESRLFASNGNFYISAETHLVLASGASGNTVPNNVVINKDGRMFIANNLAVGHAGFIMDSYKLNVAGDAYVNGKLVVSGTIYPSISSFHNIGDSSKRFACVYADSVDVGGVKIRLLQDGVLFIDGNLAVKGGITSYVDGGDLDLPSIYDGLPIDGDTLYWVLDENGKKVMLKSKGGDEEGGGSVKSLLRWSGFREGSWDGSEEKTIEIPAKLSELDSNDDLTLGGSLNMPSGYSQVKCGEKNLLECYSGTNTYLHGENHLYLVSNGLYTLQNGAGYKILHEGNYRDYEYTAKGLSVTDIRNTTPKPSDLDTFAVSAQFTNTDNPGGGWYSGLSIQGWTNDYKAWQLRSGAMDFASDHLYFRNGVLETWNDWRRVITGDVDGVLDFNLELKGEEGGNIKFVYNSDSAITTNKPNDLASIRHALRFPWHGEAYEIGTIRGNAAHSDGFGVTHQNNHLVWKVNREQMDVYEDLKVHGNIVIDTDNLSAIDVSHRSSSLWNFALTSFNPIMPDGSLEIIEFGKGKSAYNAGSIGFKYFGDSSPNNMMTISLFNSDEILNITGHRKVGINTTTPRYDLEVNGQMGVYGDLRVKNGLIRYNEEEGYFYLEGNLVVSGGISSYVDVGNLNLPSIYDGLPVDKTTIGWKEVTDASGAKSKVLGIIGDIDDTVMWSDIEGIPSWIGSSKPSYSYSEISGTPDLTKYALKENIPSLSGYATQDWVNKQGYVTSSALGNYLPLTGGTLTGGLNIDSKGELWVKGDSYFGSSGVCVIREDSKNKRMVMSSIYGFNITNNNLYYLNYTGGGIRVNEGLITYNKKDGYWKMEGNLLVTGGITSYSSDGKASPFLVDVDKLENITSDSKTQVYTANVVTLLKKQLDIVDTKADASETRISNLKTALGKLSASNVSALVSALKNLDF